MNGMDVYYLKMRMTEEKTCKAQRRSLKGW
jgi:hypothetical protein